MQNEKKVSVKEKFAGATYPIHVVGRHVSVTEPMKNYAVEKLMRVERFGGHVVEATITMDIQKLVHSVDFIILVNNTKIKVKGRTEDMYSAIDQAIARLEMKLRKYVKRLHEHHAKGLNAIDVNVNVIPVSPLDDINDQIEEENLKKIEEELTPHKVTHRETKPLKMLTLDEAIMKIELSGDRFLLYRSEEDQKLKVIYRRETDGEYGVIEPE